MTLGARKSLKEKLSLVLVTALLWFFTAVPSIAQSIQYDFTNTSVLRVNLPQSQSVTIELSAAASRIVVADPTIADAQPITDQSIYLVGKQLGRTTVNIFNEQLRPVGLIEVEVGVDTADIAASIRGVAPNSNVHVGTVNGRVRLTGQVPDDITMQRVLQVAAQYGGDNIINAIGLREQQQVNLQVRILEAQRNAGRALGVQLGGSIGGVTTNTNTGASTFDGAVSTFIASVMPTPAVQVDVTINALEQRGLVRTLAEPNLTTLSGEAASFLAGGEVPVRVRDGAGDSTVQYKNFGVQLNFLPEVLDDDRIQIRLTPEVSELSGQTTAGDPIFSTRSLGTTVELRDGQSFAVAGLLQASHQGNQEQLPWIGDIPIIGALFRSADFQRRESELVVIITPRFVRPSVPGQPLLTPLDNSLPANDPEFFLLGEMEVTQQMLHSFQSGAGIVGPFGHILDLN